MYVQSLLAGALITTTAAAAEPMVFHTAYFPDATAASLSVADKTLSPDGSYDFDVMIRLTEVDALQSRGPTAPIPGRLRGRELAI